MLYQRMGRLAEAEREMRGALRITQTRLGNDHRDVAICLHHLAALLQRLDRRAEALKLQELSLRNTAAAMHEALSFSSESAMEDHQVHISGALPSLISMALAPGADADAAATALTWTLRLKAVIVDTVCRYRQMQHLLLPDQALTKRVGEYRRLKQQLANAALNPPKGLARAQLDRQMAQWRTEADA